MRGKIRRGAIEAIPRWNKNLERGAGKTGAQDTETLFDFDALDLARLSCEFRGLLRVNAVMVKSVERQLSTLSQSLTQKRNPFWVLLQMMEDLIGRIVHHVRHARRDPDQERETMLQKEIKHHSLRFI